MTVTTGAFDSYGIPQGLPNRLDDLSDVDAGDVKEEDGLIYRNGRWLPGEVNHNEVTIGDTEPTDGSELWLNTAQTGSALNDIYVNTSGDTMTGALGIDAPGDPQGNGEEPPTLNIKKYIWPRIDLYKSSAGTNMGRWKIYISGSTPGTVVPTDNALSFAAGYDDPVGVVPNQVTFRMQRDGGFLIPKGGFVRLVGADADEDRYLMLRPSSAGGMGIRVADVNGGLMPIGVMDPNLPEHASSRAYVDGSGGFVSVSGSVPSSATTTTHLATVDEAAVIWGDGSVESSGSSLIIKRAGYYQCSFNGGFGSNGAGTVRLMHLFDYDANTSPPPHVKNVNNITQYAAAVANTGGYGAGLSATGIWYIPANHRIVVKGRQDSGVALTGTATLTIRSIPGM